MLIPIWSPPHAMQIFRYAEQGSIKMLWIIATNPLVSLPDSGADSPHPGQEDLFVVVQDAFMTETAAVADVVLPAALWGEKTGTFTNTDRTVHISYKAVDPPGEARSDFDILLDYARRMDFRDKDGAPLIKWSDPGEYVRSLEGVFAGASMRLYRLELCQAQPGYRHPWPCNEQYPDGAEQLYAAACSTQRRLLRDLWS